MKEWGIGISFTEMGGLYISIGIRFVVIRIVHKSYRWYRIKFYPRNLEEAIYEKSRELHIRDWFLDFKLKEFMRKVKFLGII